MILRVKINSDLPRYAIQEDEETSVSSFSKKVMMGCNKIAEMIVCLDSVCIIYFSKRLNVCFTSHWAHSVMGYVFRTLNRITS